MIGRSSFSFAQEPGWRQPPRPRPALPPRPSARLQQTPQPGLPRPPTPNPSTRKVIATALHVIVHCVTAPPSLAYLLPAPDGSGSGPPTRQRSAAAAAPTPTPAGGPPFDTPSGRPGGGSVAPKAGAAGAAGAAGGGPAGGEAGPAAGAAAAAPSPSSAPAPALSPRRPDASEPAPPSLELGPAAVGGAAAPTLGDALEAGYAAARQAVRAANGIRVLLSLLQSRQHFAAAAADRTRALTVAALLGLARDAHIRHILNRLQVGVGRCGGRRCVRGCLGGLVAEALLGPMLVQ
jgi:hypothetical protein